jgi:hypothetical protein
VSLKVFGDVQVLAIHDESIVVNAMLCAQCLYLFVIGNVDEVGVRCHVFTLLGRCQG